MPFISLVTIIINCYVAAIHINLELKKDSMEGVNEKTIKRDIERFALYYRKLQNSYQMG